MNIPFYRHIKYLDDGHELYQCLQCGEKIDVGEWRFNPNYCCYCGVKYEGFILPKKTDYVLQSSTQEPYFLIQDAWNWDDGTELRWDDTWRGSPDLKIAWKLLKDARVNEEDDKKDRVMSKSNEGNKFRIVIAKMETRHSCDIDVDEYYRRTGKKFDKKLYEKVT
jgi:hypothetical protein